MYFGINYMAEKFKYCIVDAATMIMEDIVTIISCDFTGSCK